MTETMVERVARAIALAHLEPEARDAVDPEKWFVSEGYHDLAHAAIEAMRDEDENTDGMLEAGRVALHAPENRHGAVLGAVFCAMLDAALKE